MARTTAQAVTNQLSSQVGYREGSNNYNKYAPIAGHANNQAWCATFLVAMFKQAGQELPRWATSASCYYNCKAFKDVGRFSYYPAVGAIFFIGPSGTTHTGYVYKYDANYIYTIEGNTNDNGSANGNGVYRRRRTRASIYGYGYPNYSHAIKSADPKWGGAKSGGSSHTATPDFPGSNKFGPGKNNAYVTQLGKWLVQRGGGRFYVEGPGPRWSDADKDATQAFQKAQGWTGKNADGIPGPTTWDYLKNNKGKDIPAEKKPTKKTQATPKVDPDAYPGWDKFGPGANNKYVTRLGEMLIKRGGKRFYKQGPGPKWGEADRKAMQAFEAAQGWKGDDVDGRPGAYGWKLLVTGKGKDIPAEKKKAAKKPKPAKHPDAGTWIYFENAGPGAGKTNANLVIQKALKFEFKDFDYSSGPGVFGPATKKYYSKWQKKLGYKGAAADGIPGRTSLEKLADKYRFDVRYKKKTSSGGSSGGRVPSPVPGHRVTFPYGVRRASYAAGYHTGDDYAAATGTPVVAVRNGTIQWSNGSGGAYGNWIGLRADNGRVYVYCHLSSRSVSTGTRVSAGQQIGRVGSTGNSTGPHLHFEDHPSGGFTYGECRKPAW